MISTDHTLEALRTLADDMTVSVQYMGSERRRTVHVPTPTPVYTYGGTVNLCGTYTLTETVGGAV